MILEFPRYVFKSPVAVPKLNGTYSSLIVLDQKEYDAAIKEGWFYSVGDILEAFDKKVPEPLIDVKEIDTTSAPTRGELEFKAAELKIKYHPMISNANLLKKIEDALKD